MCLITGLLQTDLIWSILLNLTYNIDVVHVSCRDLLTNLLDQVQGELDIISLAWLRVNIPHRKQNLRDSPLDLKAYHRLR